MIFYILLILVNCTNYNLKFKEKSMTPCSYDDLIKLAIEKGDIKLLQKLMDSENINYVRTIKKNPEIEDKLKKNIFEKIDKRLKKN